MNGSVDFAALVLLGAVLLLVGDVSLVGEVDFSEVLFSSFDGAVPAVGVVGVVVVLGVGVVWL